MKPWLELLFGAILGPIAIGVVASAFVIISAPQVHAAECGIASFYGAERQGKPMANGAPFNRNALTAASWDYPLGTRVRVSAGNRSVVVVISDRGPAHYLHRIIDLSEASFRRIAPTALGKVRVCVERVG